MINNQSAAPLRVKVSTDFGSVNADLSTATVAGTSYTGASRAAPPAGQGILVNLSGAVDADGDLLIEVQYQSTWLGVRPVRVQSPSGAAGYVLAPAGYGHPTGFTNWRVLWAAKAASAALVVTSQAFAY